VEGELHLVISRPGDDPHAADARIEPTEFDAVKRHELLQKYQGFLKHLVNVQAAANPQSPFPEKSQIIHFERPPINIKCDTYIPFDILSLSYVTFSATVYRTTN
jgi:hypothetical protein